MPDLVERVKPAVVYIVTTVRGKKEIGQGSGFFIRSDQIISNWHVVEDAQSILVKTAHGEVLEAKSVVATDRKHDLALLQLGTPADRVATLKIASSVPREGERVIVVGNPRGFGWSMSDGRVASIRQSKGGSRLLQITAPVSAGSSGSPVMNMRGEVVGVAAAIKEGGQNLNFAISGEHVAKLYSDSSESGQLLPTERLPARAAHSSGLDDTNAEISPTALKMSRSFYYQGTVLQSKDDCKGALPFFEKAVVVNSKFAEAWFSLAFCKSELGRVNAAIENYRRVAQLTPDMYDAHWNLALLYFKNKQYRDSATSFKSVVSLKPDSAEGHFNLGLSYLYGSQSAEAIGSFKQVIRLKPDDANAYYMLGRALLDSGKYADGAEAFRRSDLFNPGDAWSIYWWGVALIELKNYGEAVEKLKEAINLRSDFSEAYSALGLAHYHSNQFEAAIADYKRAIDLKEDDIEPYQRLSDVLLRLGRKDESVALFRDLLAKKPENSEALLMLGAALIHVGNEAEAREYIEKAYRLNPTDAEPRTIIAYNYTKTGNYERAIIELTESLRLAPEDSSTYLARALNYLYARHGNPAVNDALKYLALEGWRHEHSQYMVFVAHFGYRLEKRHQEARKVLIDCASRCDATSWPYPITHYLRGEIPETTLINSATDNDKMTEAHAYIGMNQSLLGQFQEALKHFRWVKESGNRDFVEFRLALSESTYIETIPKSSGPKPTIKQLPLTVGGDRRSRRIR